MDGRVSLPLLRQGRHLGLRSRALHVPALRFHRCADEVPEADPLHNAAKNDGKKNEG
jgi:hypothetical protein